jgi:hypothetical protein
VKQQAVCIAEGDFETPFGRNSAQSLPFSLLAGPHCGQRVSKRNIARKIEPAPLKKKPIRINTPFVSANPSSKMNFIVLAHYLSVVYSASIPTVIDADTDLIYDKRIGFVDASTLFPKPRMNTAKSLERNTTEPKKGLVCRDGKVYSQVYGTYTWVLEKSFESDQDVNADVTWERTVKTTVTTSFEELNSLATSSTQTHTGSVSIEATGNFFFGSVTASADYSFADEKMTSIGKETKTSGTVTREDSETISTVVKAGTKPHIYVGTMQFPGFSLPTSKIRITSKPLPEREPVFMLMPVVAAGSHACEDRTIQVELWKEPNFSGLKWTVANGTLPAMNYEWVTRGNCDSQLPGLIYEFSSAKWTTPNQFKQICFYAAMNCPADAQKHCFDGTEVADFGTVGLDNKVWSYSVDFQ